MRLAGALDTSGPASCSESVEATVRSSPAAALDVDVADHAGASESPPPHALQSPEKRRQGYERIPGLPFPDKLPRHEIAPEEAPQRPDDEEG